MAFAAMSGLASGQGAQAHLDDAPYGHGLSGIAAGRPQSANNTSMINVLLDALAQDIGRRLESVEQHIIERSNKLEHMLEQADHRWEGIRQASSSVPELVERIEQSLQAQMDKTRYTVEGIYWQVEQLVGQHGPESQKENTGVSKSPSETTSAPCFGEQALAAAPGPGADELDGIMAEIPDSSFQSQPDDEWVGHVERHLQQIHMVLEEMSLQHTNLQVKMNTVHNKVSDTHQKVSEDASKGARAVGVPSSLAVAVPIKTISVKSIKSAPPGPVSPTAAQNTDTPDDSGNSRHDLVHAFHSAMGHKKRNLHPHHGASAGREHWQAVVNTHWFHIISVSTITLNGLLIGVEQHYEVNYLIDDILYREGVTSGSPTEINKSFFRVLDIMCILFWSIELVLNALSQGSHYFEVHNPMAKWNVFDIVCLTVSILQLVADTLSSSLRHVPGLSGLQMLRVARVIRVLRVVKVVKAFQGVRKLVIAVHGALLTLFWALMLLALLLYMFTIMISCGLSSYYEGLDIRSQPPKTRVSDEETATQTIAYYYGGVPATMATLFQSITGGDWTVMALPVFNLSWAFHFIWYSYIAFVLFGLLNVFTGIFVESATFAANSDREIKMQAQMEEENSYLNQIRTIFQKTDSDNSGNMTEGELAKLMDQADFKQQLEMLGIHPTEAHGLFKLLDDDGSGSVSIEEFLSGCIRLKGTAKAVDMITLLFETSKMNRRIEQVRKMLIGAGMEASAGDDAMSGTPSEADTGDPRSPRSGRATGSDSLLPTVHRSVSSMSVTSF